MSRHTKIAALLCLGLSPMSATAAGPEQPAPTMQALLEEIRQLRSLIERSAVAIPRYNSAVQKWQLQQARVDFFADRLEQLKSTPGESVRDIEGRLYREISGDARRALEQLLQAAKSRAAQEQQLARQLQIEQTRLREFHQDLRRAELQLEPVPKL